MILFFNCYIDDKLEPAFDSNSYSIMPVMYPREDGEISELNKILILQETIKSYSKINFEYSVFNIELANKIHEEEIRKTIYEYYKIPNVILNFSRPNNSQEWNIAIDNLIETHGESKLCFLAMNHDHPFISKNLEQFNLSVEEAFTDDDVVYVYSHTPEYLSIALNNKKHIVHNYGVGIENQSFTESISISKLKTLKKQFAQVKSNGKSYMGRIDWPNIKYRRAKFTCYVPLREHFRHFDAYGHITTLRYSQPLGLGSVFCIEKNNRNYESEWISLYHFYIRSGLNKYCPILINQKLFLKKYKKSICLFLEKNIQYDLLKDQIEYNKLKCTFPLHCSYGLNDHIGKMLTDLMYSLERNYKNLFYKIISIIKI